MSQAVLEHILKAKIVAITRTKMIWLSFFLAGKLQPRVRRMIRSRNTPAKSVPKIDVRLIMVQLCLNYGFELFRLLCPEKHCPPLCVFLLPSGALPSFSVALPVHVEYIIIRVRIL